MRKLATITAILIAITANAQMMGGKPPAEMSKVGFFTGTWTGKETYGGMGAPTTVSGTFVGKKILKGRYIQDMHRTAPSKMGTTEGMHLLTYDPTKKSYVAYWFDSEAPNGMKITGNFVGKSLVMSGTEEMEGMGPVQFRATWTHSGNTLTFKLEAQMGGKWSTFIDGKYHR